jgi:hypothetical protein
MAVRNDRVRDTNRELFLAGFGLLGVLILLCCVLYAAVQIGGVFAAAVAAGFLLLAGAIVLEITVVSYELRDI